MNAPKRRMHQRCGCTESSNTASSGLEPRVAEKGFPSDSFHDFSPSTVRSGKAQGCGVTNSELQGQAWATRRSCLAKVCICFTYT